MIDPRRWRSLPYIRTFALAPLIPYLEYRIVRAFRMRPFSPPVLTDCWWRTAKDASSIADGIYLFPVWRCIFERWHVWRTNSLSCLGIFSWWDNEFISCNSSLNFKKLPGKSKRLVGYANVCSEWDTWYISDRNKWILLLQNSVVFE